MEPSFMMSTLDDKIWDGSSESTAKKMNDLIWEGDEINIERLPYLTRDVYLSGNLVPGQTLIRWVGMVQDQGSPEYYPLKVNDRICMYRDVSSQHSDWNVLDSVGVPIGERQPLFCVPIPGLSLWARSAILGNSTIEQIKVNSLSMPRTKRNRQEDDPQWIENTEKESSDMVLEDSSLLSVNISPPNKKRNDDNSKEIGRQIKTLSQPSRPETDIECVIRFYGPDDSPKLNSLIEVVAVLGNEVLEPTEYDVDDWHASASRVARLHALAVRPLNTQSLTNCISPNIKDDIVLAREVRGRAIHWLAQTCLGGDAHAAEYLFLAMCISKRFATIANTERALGLLSLELITPTDCATKLSLALSELVPCCRLIKSSQAKNPPSRGFYNESGQRIDSTTNDDTYWIGKDERLAKDSPLQAAESTLLIIDHDSLFWPTLTCLITDAKYVPYDFGYTDPTRFPVDLPTLVVTNNRKGVGCDCSLAINDFSAMLHDEGFFHLPDAALLRSYVAQARTHKPDLPLDDDLPKVIQDDFVDARSKGLIPHNEAEARIHLWLTLARLHARSLFADKITIEHWQHCKKLENNRIIRLNSMRRIAGL